MTAVQQHALNITDWELQEITQWILDMEVLRQALLTSGHTEKVADDCIIDNLLLSLISVPASAPCAKDWESDA
eukprot:574275-Rhodomonas_salina.1